MLLTCESDSEQAVPATFLALPLFDPTPRATTECALKKCCKKYKKGKRCKSCPER